MRVAIDSIAESVDYGLTASARTQPVGPKFLRITDVQDGRVDWNSVPWCECDERKLRAARLRRGDIVFARTGATTGKSFLINECPNDAVFASYLIRVRLAKRADSGYVSHFFQTPDYWSQIRKSARGVAQPGVNATTLRALQIPLPPLAEQKRIAAILDATNALRTKRREALAQLGTLLQSTFLDMFGDPVTNPMRWKVENLRDWLDSIDSGWSPKCQERKSESGEWGILKLGAVTWCEFNQEEQKALPPNLEPRPELEIKKGDLLFSRKNTYDLVAAAAYVFEVRRRLMLSDLIFRLRLTPRISVDPKFLWQLLIEPHQRQTIQRLAGGAAGSMPNISKAKLGSVELIRPPLHLQRRFATIVESVERQKARMRAHLAELDALFASLQSRAFNGEL